LRILKEPAASIGVRGEFSNVVGYTLELSGLIAPTDVLEGTQAEVDSPANDEEESRGRNGQRKGEKEREREGRSKSVIP